MTYLHALQYLTEKATPAPSLPQEADKRAYAKEIDNLYAAFSSDFVKEDTGVHYLLFSADSFGQLCATYCRSALMAQGITVGEIADQTVGPINETLRINGAPVSPAQLRELCHSARAAEQQSFRRAAKSAALQSGGVPLALRSVGFSSAQRCGAVLPRLFFDAQCRVILLIGDIQDAALRLLSQRAADRSIAVLSASPHKPLQRFPAGTKEVVCPTCSSAVFHQVTDACARTGSRLTLMTTSHLSRSTPLPFSQTFSYRSVTDCPLRNGSMTALRAATLATEALLVLRRLGCTVSDDAMRKGFSDACLPLFFSPVSIDPLVIAHAYYDEDDIDTLKQALQEFAPTFPAPCRLYGEDALLDALRDHLLPADACFPLSFEGAESEQGAKAVHLLVGSTATLTAHIAALQQQIRRL